MKKVKLTSFYKILLVIILILNCLLIARFLEDIYFPGETSSLEKARQGAQSVISYSENLAKSYGVAERKSVQDVLARFKYEIEKADSEDEVASLMVDYGRQIQDTIFRELQNKRINEILNIVNSQKLPEKGRITMSRVEDKIKFVDSQNILTDETKEKLAEIALNQTIEIKIENNTASLSTSGEFFNQVDFLQTKVASLERQLKVIKERTGYADLSGEGIIINVFDKEGELENIGVVHDSDIRDIINELLIVGARGVEVGGQRLTAISPIRCVGPTILVNNKPIPVNPVVIKAVGDPDILASSLDIIKNQLASFGIKLEIIKKERITLNTINESW